MIETPTTEISLELLNELNEAIRADGENGKDGHLYAANVLADAIGLTTAITEKQQALEFLDGMWHQLLDQGDYAAAGTLIFGFDVLDPRPECTRRIFDAIPKHSLLAFQGASSMSKTYAVQYWNLLDWLRDPVHTRIIVCSTNSAALKSKIFADIVSAFQRAALPMPSYSARFGNGPVIKELFIGMQADRFEGAIHGVFFPQDDVGTGRLKGFKTTPRGFVDPRFGKMTRLRLLLDEATDMPGGVFDDLPSVTNSIHGVENIKVMMMYNPKESAVGGKVHQMVEPVMGWKSVDMETTHEWQSKQRWHVVRLDGARSENVRQKQLVYPGIATHEGFSRLMTRGANHPEVLCYARGMFPTSSTKNVVINRQFVDRQVGIPNFVGRTKSVASLDVAFTGDRPILTLGKWGIADSVETALGVEYFYERDKYGNNTTRKKPRLVLGITAQIELERTDDTIALARIVASECRRFGVEPEHLVLDQTGVGKGLYDYLRSYWGGVYGVSWGAQASGSKVVAEDEDGAFKYYDGITSEMWYTFQRWLHYGIIWIYPSAKTDDLTNQLSERATKNGRSGKAAVESKGEFKSRRGDNASPDHADSAIMLPQMIRVRMEDMPGMLHDTFHDDDDEEVDHTGEPTRFVNMVDEPDALKMSSSDEDYLHG